MRDLEDITYSRLATIFVHVAASTLSRAGARMGVVLVSVVVTVVIGNNDGLCGGGTVQQQEQSKRGTMSSP